MNNDRLKFRLWDIKNEEYVEDQCDECCIYFDGRLHAGAYCDDGYTGHWGEYEQHEVIIEQCTGLKDKNGNLIYESDIVRYGSNTSMGVVKYGEFNCSCCEGVYGWYFDNEEDIRNYEYYEVIGNIHEQPEQKDE